MIIMDGPRWGGVIGDYPVERTAVVAAALLGEPAEREDTADARVSKWRKLCRICEVLRVTRMSKVKESERIASRAN